MDIKHIFIIKPGIKSHEIEKMIHKIMQNRNYEIRYTAYPRHATLLVQEYRQQKCRIYAIGGDGLIHEIVQALAGSKNELVILPDGTGNDFARTLGQGKQLQQFLEKSLSLKAQAIDLIKANDIYCINILCCAFDSDVANNVHNYKQIKLLPRSLQYIKVLIKRIQVYRCQTVELHQREQLLFKGRLLIGAFCNGRYFGGGFEIAPNAKINDGLLDVILVAKMPVLAMPYYIYLFLRKKLTNGKRCLHYQGEVFLLKTTQDINIDGEKYPSGEYQIKLEKKKLNVVIDRENIDKYI